MFLDVESAEERTLRYHEALRHDLKLLEITDDLMEELQTGKCVDLPGFHRSPEFETAT
jgi:hypothetical protein